MDSTEKFTGSNMVMKDAREQCMIVIVGQFLVHSCCDSVINVYVLHL